MPFTRLDLRGVPATSVASRLPRPAEAADSVADAVRAILGEVRAGGDGAVRECTYRFDGVQIGALRVPPEDVAAARRRISPELLDALERAYGRILAYHRHEPAPAGDFELDGVRVRPLIAPVRRAGFYAPGGRARYPSTVLMCAAPAQVAGVDDIALCVPPGPDGTVADETLAAAAVCGVSEVYRVGGAQAIAAMAFGTESIAPVDVIVGPGNRYVAEAKRQVASFVGVPSAYAGPSEVVVVADDSAPTAWAAIDLVVQAEHGPDGSAWLVSWSPTVVDAVEKAVDEMVADSSRRADLEATFASGGYAVLVDGPAQALAVAAAIAPEHLELMVDGAEALLPLVRNAGAVFVGAYAPASVGDYMAGPNHVLPTARTARFASVLRVDDFRTFSHAVFLDAAALAGLAPYVATIAEAEGLEAHALSVRMRGA